MTTPQEHRPTPAPAWDERGLLNDIRSSVRTTSFCGDSIRGAGKKLVTGSTRAWLYENHCADRVATRLSAFVALAFHQPQLRELRPYTSHWTLCFSRTPRWPYTWDHPTVAPVEAPGRYLVRTRDGRTYDETDAAGALALVLAELPDD